MKDSDFGGEISGRHSESVLITKNKVGEPRFPANVLTCKRLQTQRTDFFLKHDSWSGPPALHPLCLETTQTGGLGEAAALNVLAGLLQTAEALKCFHEGLLIKDRGRLFVCY